MHKIISLAAVLISLPLNAQVFDEIETGNTCSYFGETIPEKVTTFSSDQEAESVIKKIVDSSGLVQNFQVRAAGVPNAAAVIRGDTRYILYNQYFMQNTKRSTGSNWAPISIMAHEVGHHLNGHTLDKRGSRPKIELEADYYSGFILQRMGASIDDARAAMSKLGSASGSNTHPAKHDRLAAIGSGWTKACESDPACTGDDSSSRTREQPSSRDTSDSRRSREENGPDSCEYANDGECDEPDLCDRGTDSSDCQTRSSRSRSDYPRQQQSLYCCDQYGRKRCAITFNPGPPGTPCICAGIPGSGWMCN